MMHCELIANLGPCLQTEGLGEFLGLLSFRDLLPGAERGSQAGVRGAKVGRAGASEARPARATKRTAGSGAGA